MTQHSAPLDDPAPEDESRTPQSVRRIPWWIFAVVILGAALTATGAVISKVAPAILTNGGPITDAVQVYANYLFARNLALAVMLLFLLIIRTRRMLAGFLVLTAFIQVLDVINDLTTGDFLLVPGLLVFAIVFLIAAWRLFGQAIWHLDAWRDL